MKKIIVTGGLGFIGSNLIKLLIKKNYFVINVDKVDIKINRLKLCNKIRKLMHSVAYFGQLNFWCYFKYVNERKL